MKTDNYLNLCLEQAAKSPLRYRHGAIIVRGGKVIGQGYNDHRSGFDGGALKTGRLPLRSSTKRELGIPEGHVNKTFTPFESMGGGGKLANTPLSMHSEMMAIHSALSASSTLASSAVSSEKPCFKLSGDSKRKSRLRREAINSYVKAICEAALAQSTAASGNAQSGVQEWRFESSASGSRETEPCVSRPGEERERGLIGSEQYGETPPEEREESSSSQAWQQIERQNPPTARSQPMLMPKGQTGQSSRNLKDRTKSPRLNGADLYVVRLGWQCAPKVCWEEPDEDAATLPQSRPATGSLHDELTSPEPARPARTKHPPTPTKDEKQPTVLSSRPCYRCISYMASVGIKRVFWTDDKGGWESAKVRDLVDALDNIGSQSPTDASVGLNSVFVTKHEVLMLRRIMGES
ncbi:uncharacterized protein J4E88_001727 [Alternaria novae-zelandiae]|uniref:uncharacterized protein n=1 Tax=Alternaria novae-zelandiae TaxID=430562 RepID=UPI0020C3219A|nr:uncharacterized protein J4E88_001727 [Alternaria novae-zelandiae]KAI4693356.1 hypothetical protein J4E88_001727 [Alternaria novae-zelandiae]